MSINKVMITGNLTRDPELRSTTSGLSVLSLGVAVNDRRRNQETGQWEDVPNFIECTMFGTRAESLSRFLQKGSKVAIEGKLRYRSWEKDGQKQSRVSVVIDDLEFMSPRNGGAYQQDAPSAPASASSAFDNIPPAPTADAYSDEDIPF